MKQKTGMLALLILALFIGVFTLTRKNSESPREMKVGAEVESNEKGTASSPGSRTAKGSLLSLREMISSPVRTENQTKGDLSEACARLTDDLLRLSLNDLNDPARVRLPNPEGCSPPNPKLAKMLRHYATACAAVFPDASVTTPAPTKTPSRANFTPCQMATTMLRSTLAVISRGERPLSQITDPRELADLLVSGFGQLFTEDLSAAASAANITAVADRMLELDPRYVPAMKAGALGQMLDFSMRKEALEKGTVPEGTSVEPPNWNELERRVAQIAENTPNDPDLETLRRVAETDGMTPDLVRKDALERLAKNPNDSAEIQNLAWAYFRSGHRQEAKAEMDRAIALDPRNPELRANRAIVTHPKSRPEDFKLVMKVGVGFSDLLK